MKKLVLASGSPRRREILEQAGLTFTVVVSDVDETTGSAEPEEMVKELALRKAEAAAALIEAEKGVLILGADTVVVCDGRILGKPADRPDAVGMITLLQGRKHEVYSGVAVLETGVRAAVSFAERTEVSIRPMTETEIEEYVSSAEPYDKAGGYGIQGKFGVYVSGIQGDYYNVVGLPLCRCVQELKNMGL